MSDARILPFGEGALLVELARTATAGDARRAQALAGAIDRLRSRDIPLSVPVPGAASVLVGFDPLATSLEVVADHLRRLVDELPANIDPAPGTTHMIPVRYGGDDGPDLEAVAAELGRTPADVIALHAAATYEVLFLGFAPGFAYLGPLPEELVVPRLGTPRVRVPAGSVAIAATMSAVYPSASAGGWRLLGRTDARVFDPDSPQPARFAAGDLVRFVPA